MSAPRLHRLLVRLHPASHRRRYGAEMLAVLAHRYAGVRRPAERARLHVVTLADLAWNGALLWLGAARRFTRGFCEGLGTDLRFVLRTLTRGPGYAATALVVVAGAVAINATVFGFVKGTLLNEPPYQDPARIVLVWGSSTSGGQLRDVISGPNFIDFRRSSRTLQTMAAFHEDGSYITVDGHPEVLGALEVSVDFLDVLGVGPMLGRDFDERDRMSGAPAAVLVSHAFWQDHLDGDPGVIGRALVMEGSPKTILGVLPPGFEFSIPAPIYMPLRDDVLAADERGRIHYNVIGRLAPGRSSVDATLELSAVMRAIAREHGMYEGWSVRAEPLLRVSVEAVRPVILALSATVGLVLLIALVNLATLFRVRSLARADELAVRLALGAGRWRVARILSLEAAALAGVGALLGLSVTPPLLGWVTQLVPLWIPIPGSAARVPVLRGVLDATVAGVALGAAVVGALLLTLPGVVGAIRAGASARGGRSVHAGIRGTRALVAVELATATVLCLGAALSAKSAAGLLATEVGLEDRGLLTLYFGDRWDGDEASVLAYVREVVEGVEALPGVRSAAVTDYVDFEAEDDYTRVHFLDGAGEPFADIREEWRRVGFALFETAGMAMRGGRSFAREDFQGTPRTAVVNEAFARKHWPAGDALGSFISTKGLTLEVVGVVADLRSHGPAAPPAPVLYVPNLIEPRGTQALYVRVSGEPMAFAERVRDAIWSVDPSQPVDAITPMSELVGSWVAIPRASRALLVALAAAALLLSGVGVFGVVAYAVRTRRSELGLRLALGASAGRLRRDLALAILPVAVLGVAVGLVLGVAAARAAGGLLHGVSPLDPASVALAVGAMAGSVLLGIDLPSRRVARIHPSEAIRAE